MNKVVTCEAFSQPLFCHAPLVSVWRLSVSYQMCGEIRQQWTDNGLCRAHVCVDE